MCPQWSRSCFSVAGRDHSVSLVLLEQLRVDVNRSIIWSRASTTADRWAALCFPPGTKALCEDPVSNHHHHHHHPASASPPWHHPPQPAAQKDRSTQPDQHRGRCYWLWMPSQHSSLKHQHVRLNLDIPAIVIRILKLSKIFNISCSFPIQNSTLFQFSCLNYCFMLSGRHCIQTWKYSTSCRRTRRTSSFRPQWNISKYSTFFETHS